MKIKYTTNDSIKMPSYENKKKACLILKSILGEDKFANCSYTSEDEGSLGDNDSNEDWDYTPDISWGPWQTFLKFE